MRHRILSRPTSIRAIPRTAIVLAIAGTVLAACSGDRLTAPVELPPTPFIVSNPISPLGPAANERGAAGIAWVSLPYGSIPGASLATIRVLRTGAQVTAVVIDGGFDPVPVQAVMGDTVTVRVQAAESGGETEYTMIVPPEAPPHVVRTDPPPHKRDVALNYRIVVIFSEPMDSTSLAGAISLTSGGLTIPGRVAIPSQPNGILGAEFVPGGLLAPATTYELQVGTSVRDLDGQTLASPLRSDFTTADSAASPLVRINVSVTSFPSSRLRTVNIGDEIIAQATAVYEACRTSCSAPYTGDIALGLGDHPAGATLGGTLLAHMSNGVALFTNLTVDRTGSYTLVATAPGTRSSPSTPFEACEEGCWEPGADMHSPRSAVGVGVAGTTLYAIGGATARTATEPGGAPSAVVEAYDPATNTWKIRAPMPTARYGFGIGVVNDRIYVAGGITDSGTTAVVEAYDPATDTWSTRAPLPSPTGFPAAAGFDGTFYVIGGQKPDSTIVATVLAYDPTTDQWSGRAPLPTPRSHMTIGIYDGQLYAIGGLDPTFPADPNVWRTIPVYDPVADHWVARTPSGFSADTYRYYGTPLLPAVGVLPGVGILELGGSDGSTYLSTPYVMGSIYDPVENRYTALKQAPVMGDSWGSGLSSAGVVNGQLYLVGYQAYRLTR